MVAVLKEASSPPFFAEPLLLLRRLVLLVAFVESALKLPQHRRGKRAPVLTRRFPIGGLVRATFRRMPRMAPNA